MVLVYMPMVHLGQNPWPACPLVDVPALHALHRFFSCPVALRNLPDSQLMHVEMAWFDASWNFPPWHAVQPPMDAKVPDVQLLITQDARVFVAGTLEAGQVLQDGFPASFW